MMTNSDKSFMEREQELEEMRRAEREQKLSQELEEMRCEAIDRASHIRGQQLNVSSFHGIIGGKNNKYVDCVRTQFNTHEEFIARWIEGLLEEINEKKPSKIIYDTASRRILRLLKDEKVREYTLKFLERNFFRQLKARTRCKFRDELWEIWFLENHSVYGLLISPVFRKDEWTNDVSEMRRKPYEYWTIQHVLKTGLVVPGERRKQSFKDLDQILQFYNNVVKRVSVSPYEKGIIDRYIKYLEKSSDHLNEPFLIPELRYKGLAEAHEHRLDFTVLNSHIQSLIGFELSPHSTHGAIRGMANKRQKDVNQELSEQWGREMTKRNNYLNKYGIITITFADKELADLDYCFGEIERYLSARPAERSDLSIQIGRIAKVSL